PERPECGKQSPGQRARSAGNRVREPAYRVRRREECGGGRSAAEGGVRRREECGGGRRTTRSTVVVGRVATARSSHYRGRILWGDHAAYCTRAERDSDTRDEPRHLRRRGRRRWGSRRRRLEVWARWTPWSGG